ncbi:MAG: hypothetical protein KAH10_04330 [Flavobacteriales bacterium]|nr:hypothetical protein [Flavobacteriales bacterium]
MLSLVGKKFYFFWAVLLLIFPIIIHLFWLNALFSSENNTDAISTFVGYFPMLFQYTSFIAFSSMFFSALSFMFSLRLVKGMDYYAIPGVVLLLVSAYIMAFNMWNLM